MKRLLCSLSLILLLSTVMAQPIRVLFVGNSYTAYNNLASMVSQLALSKGDTMEAYSVNPGGYTFQLHSTYAPTRALIDSMPWDFVVLQEQSQLPSFPPSQVSTQVYPYARALDSLILLNNPCTETVFFMTWGRKYGDASNCASWPPVCTFAGMQQQLYDSYVQMANSNQALVAPVGRAWQQSWLNDSTINLWASDNSHPDLNGSYLSACVFYATLYRQSPVGASYTAGISPATALYLQQTAAQVVFDSLSVWNIGVYDVQSGFTASTNGLQVQFNNQSQNAQQYFWDFGDGNFSTIAQPQHQYAASGTFTVTLLAAGFCGTDLSSQTITVGSTGLSELALPEVHLQGRRFTWQSGEALQVQVFDTKGTLVSGERIPAGQGYFEVPVLPGGLYLVAFQHKEGGRKVFKLSSF